MRSKLILYIFYLCIIGCISKKATFDFSNDRMTFEQERKIITDSNCYHIFYEAVDSFLNIHRSAISDVEERHLIPCCMELINAGDTVAEAILLERITARIKMFKNGIKGYGSIYKIANATLGELQDERALTLCLDLLDNNDIKINEFGCSHRGYYIFKYVMLNIIEDEKASEYRTLASKFYNKAMERGFSVCDAESYVYYYLHPIIVEDRLQGKLRAKKNNKM